MASSLHEVLAVLDRGASIGGLGEADIAFAARVLDDLPALAWAETAVREARPHPPTTEEGAPAGLPTAVLVVGDEALADALLRDEASGPRSLECERTGSVENALELARALAPDLALIDADLAGATSLVEALLDDPLTEPVPIVVVGTFRSPEETARFVALGVARTVAKPATRDVIRAACDEILEGREEHTLRMTLGEPTLDQLATRLADELRRALVDSVDKPALAQRIPLGEGTEVLGALWGAIARVQEIVAQKTRGAIQFGGGAPEGAIALAPWLHHDVPGADRMAGRGPGAGDDVRMTGRRVVVADDDPGVTWFISDLLRTAGCEVFEALDGTTALELAYRVQPELVVSDILMPGLDGFALSRALRRDVALRDTPVILLSWKEDLLQRVRELGASAAAYMRKETDSRAILARVREVLRPRARIELRLRAPGEVRGRLDGLSPRLLLDLTCAIRKDARVAVRDATFIYEVDIRGGQPRKATRAASDGSYQSGERVLASLLGVGAGRFILSPVEGPVRGELSGTLSEQLARPIAAARGALAATTGAGTMNVDLVGLDPAIVEEYLRATPDPARTLIRRLADGASPRQMLLRGEIAPSLLEDVLADLAARGAIYAVTGTDGADLLTSAIEGAMAIARGAPRRESRRPPPDPGGLAHREAARPSPLDNPPPQASAPPSGAYVTLRLSETPPPARVDDEGSAPSSLEDAVIREISDRSPHPGSAHPRELPPIVEPSELRPRSSNPPAEDDGDARSLPSIPPDAIVPEALSADNMAATSVAVSEPTQTPPLPMPIDIVDFIVAREREPAAPAPAASAQTHALLAGGAQPLDTSEPKRTAPAAVSRRGAPPAAGLVTMRSVVSPHPKPQRSGWLGLLLAFALLLVAISYAIHGSPAAP
jgi:DNA-binding response OmpR family regulator